VYKKLFFITKSLSNESVTSVTSLCIGANPLHENDKWHVFIGGKSSPLRRGHVYVS